MSKVEKWLGVRVRLVGIAFVVIFGLLVAKAFQLQVLGQEKWQKRAELQHQRIIPLIPERGTIYDRNGEELAISLEVDSVFVEARKISDPAQTARALARVLGLPQNSISSKIQSSRNFAWIKRQVSPRESEAVRALALEGVGTIKEHRRFYPNAEIAAQIVGFTGLDPDGLEGLELKYNNLLLGQGGFLVTERDALGRGMGSGGAVVRQGQGGHHLHLTVDRNLQYIAEKELAQGVAKARAKGGTVVILDPHSGEVLAMASNPDFNPNAFQKYKPAQWRNRALSDAFEPGSTFKIFLMAAALNENIIRTTDRIYCEKGSFRVGGRTIHDIRPHETLSVPEILKVSSNIGSAKIGKALSRDRYHRYITAFGFGAPTGIELPGEAVGMVRRPAEWFEIDLAAISFGQGVSVTPLQLAVATAAIANGGRLMSPYLVERVVDPAGRVVERRTPQTVRQVISQETARQVREMMVYSLGEGSSGSRANIPGFRAGGKTGTAQKVDRVTGGYSADKRLASFVGFAPAEDPRLVILVMIDEPQGQVFGGLVAAPVFASIAGQALRHLQVRPTLPIDQEVLPPAPVVAEGGGQTFAGGMPQPGEGAEVQAQMPDLLGMSYRQVLQTMERTGLNLKLNGSGRVVEQFPASGRPIPYGTEAWVRFAVRS
jgi:cell division protein FtsI (penicillin-binding protein 3)